jgi:hypothetical protein
MSFYSIPIHARVAKNDRGMIRLIKAGERLPYTPQFLLNWNQPCTLNAQNEVVCDRDIGTWNRKDCNNQCDKNFDWNIYDLYRGGHFSRELVVSNLGKPLFKPQYSYFGVDPNDKRRYFEGTGVRIVH